MTQRRTRDQIEMIVLRQLARSNKPLGAYDIVQGARSEGNCLFATQAYRTLSRLVHARRVARLESTSTYILADKSRDAFAICANCETVVPLPAAQLRHRLSKIALSNGFQSTRIVLEAHGCCPACEGSGKRLHDFASEARRTPDSNRRTTCQPVQKPN